uniref:Uncharacterized protein n=1 Tax=Rhizophora mucronata TaxID=61149 RepID=A0A2P2PHR6_RHIMU
MLHVFCQNPWLQKIHH